MHILLSNKSVFFVDIPGKKYVYTDNFWRILYKNGWYETYL